MVACSPCKSTHQGAAPAACSADLAFACHLAPEPAPGEAGPSTWKGDSMAGLLRDEGGIKGFMETHRRRGKERAHS